MRGNWLIVLLGATACTGGIERVPQPDTIGTATAPTPMDGEVTDTFPGAAPEVDVLWVVDGAGIPGSELAAFIDEVPAFLDFFAGAGDAHIGVLGALDDTQAGFGQIAVLTDAVDPVSELTATLQEPTTGAARDSVHAALESLADTLNPGFRRPGASLSVLHLQDRDDTSDDLTTDDYIAWLTGTDDATSHLVATDALCATALLDYATATFGTAWCGQPMPIVMDAAAVEAADVRTTFELTERPQVETIEVLVEVDGSYLAFDDGDWTYADEPNTVSFTEFVPPRWAQVEIRYEPAP